MIEKAPSMSDPKVYGVGVVMDGVTSLVDAREEALKWLENSVCVGVFNCPFLRNIRGGERLKK